MCLFCLFSKTYNSIIALLSYRVTGWFVQRRLCVIFCRSIWNTFYEQQALKFDVVVVVVIEHFHFMLKILKDISQIDVNNSQKTRHARVATWLL